MKEYAMIRLEIVDDIENIVVDDDFEEICCNVRVEVETMWMRKGDGDAGG